MYFFVQPGNYTVTAGKSIRVSAEIANFGTSPLNHISFSYLAPENWNVNFDVKDIAVLNPGDQRIITITITSPRNTPDNNTDITLIAKSVETQQSTTIFLQIEKGVGFWLWVGVGFTVLLIIIFILIYRRLNR